MTDMLHKLLQRNYVSFICRKVWELWGWNSTFRTESVCSYCRNH